MSIESLGEESAHVPEHRRKHDGSNDGCGVVRRGGFVELRVPHLAELDDAHGAEQLREGRGHEHDGECRADFEPDVEREAVDEGVRDGAEREVEVVAQHARRPPYPQVGKARAGVRGDG
eukprot:CAMPEP_0183293728 /NCGR_PEP_ID=MMETSP0160_2-20130417/2307_1 /TAXON_ID=2839 ORGANISM="Odontella Sinensis, Strain Grunow 1884" /NCGR_SAMPLE_ID=MMETSP0160_2 /ASSEMBLY_ACC=CAM_ASM_000250 /LENGTH=118 /DNA_ID=CAMNT_0025454893 /DNA_START=788 /DNA_END=1144 /DNA_ORIENTATION=+